MLVLNDPAAQVSSVDASNANGAATAAPVADLSAFASSNDIAVKVSLFLVVYRSWSCCNGGGLFACCRAAV